MTLNTRYISKVIQRLCGGCAGAVRCLACVCGCDVHAQAHVRAFVCTCVRARARNGQAKRPQEPASFRYFRNRASPRTYFLAGQNGANSTRRAHSLWLGVHVVSAEFRVGLVLVLVKSGWFRVGFGLALQTGTSSV